METQQLINVRSVILVVIHVYQEEKMDVIYANLDYTIIHLRVENVKKHVLKTFTETLKKENAPEIVHIQNQLFSAQIAKKV